MRRVWLVLVAAIVMSASAASAGPSRAAANQPTKSARAKPAKPARSAKPTANTKPAIKAFAADAEEADESVASPAPIKPVAANALLVQYQRVGRDLLLLANERRAQIGVEVAAAKLSCAELQATFRAIKIDDAVKTPQSRVATAAVLAELHTKIERLRGVALSQECLNNPLAKECT
jgi:hypothetical protein